MVVSKINRLFSKVHIVDRLNNIENLKNTKNIIELNGIVLKQHQVIYNLLTIIQELPGSIYWKNKKGTYLGHNKFSKKEMEKLNLSTNIAGKTDFDLFPYEVATQYREHDLKVMSSGQPFFKEEAIHLPNGKQIVQISHKKPLRDEQGNIIGIIGNTIDITNVKLIEQELMQAKENTSHMANSLVWLLHNLQFYFQKSLKEILLLTNIVLPAQNNPDQKTLLTEIKNLVTVLLHDCEELLQFNFNNLNISNISSSSKNFKLINLTKNLINTSMKLAKSRNLQLIYKISEDIPMIVIGDLNLIRKILQLILVHAIKTSITDAIIMLNLDLVQKFDNKIIIKFTVEYFKDLFQNLTKKPFKINKSFNIKKLLKQSINSDPKISIIILLVKKLNGNFESVKEHEKLKHIFTLELNYNN